MESVNTPTMSHVETMLDIWAQWSKKGKHNGLGFSRYSNLALLQEFGVYLSVAKGPRSPESDPVAEEMDTWVAELMRQHPREAETLIIYYVGEFIVPDNEDKKIRRIKSPPLKEIIARKFKTTVRTIDMRLYYAKLWLEGRYCGTKKYFINT